MKLLLRVAVAISAVIALGVAGHYAYGPKQLQAKEQPQQRELQVQHDQDQLQDESVHHTELDNRADMIGVELSFMRGATNFTDPGYRDLPNAAQMQSKQAVENDHQLDSGK